MKLREIFLDKRVIFITLLSFLSSGLMVYIGYVNLPMMNAMAASEFDTFAKFVVLTIVLYLTNNQISYFIGITGQKYRQSLALKLRSIAMKKLKKDYVESEHRVNDGKYTNMAISDVQFIEQYLLSVIQMLGFFFSIVLSFIALFYIHSTILIISIVLAALLFVLPMFFQKIIAVNTEKVSQETEEFNKNLTNHVSSVETIKNNNSFSLLRTLVEIGSKNIGQAKVNQTRQNMKLSVANVNINMMSQLIILIISGYFFHKGEIEFGAIFAISELSGNFFAGLLQFLGNYPNFVSLKTLLKKYEDVEDSEEDTTSKLDLEKALSTQGLAYSYGDKTITFPNISIEKNRKYIIVGGSGTGKSTLFNILHGNLKNYSGSVSWDSKDYKDLSFAEIKNSISIMGQKVDIFNGTIKYNILMNKSYDEKLFNEVLEKAKLKDVLEKLDNGVEEVLDSANPSLSGGQLQRVALARALYHNAKVFFIDEGTSSLDSKTSEEIEKLLFTDPSLTVVMVTHHLNNNVKDLADEVVILG